MVRNIRLSKIIYRNTQIRNSLLLGFTRRNFGSTLAETTRKKQTNGNRPKFRRHAPTALMEPYLNRIIQHPYNDPLP